MFPAKCLWPLVNVWDPRPILWVLAYFFAPRPNPFPVTTMPRNPGMSASTPPKFRTSPSSTLRFRFLHSIATRAKCHPKSTPSRHQRRGVVPSVPFFDWRRRAARNQRSGRVADQLAEASHPRAGAHLKKWTRASLRGRDGMIERLFLAPTS